MSAFWKKLVPCNIVTNALCSRETSLGSRDSTSQGDLSSSTASQAATKPPLIILTDPRDIRHPTLQRHLAAQAGSSPPSPPSSLPSASAANSPASSHSTGGQKRKAEEELFRDPAVPGGPGDPFKGITIPFQDEDIKEIMEEDYEEDVGDTRPYGLSEDDEGQDIAHIIHPAATPSQLWAPVFRFGGSRIIVVVDTTGIHELPFDFCTCRNAPPPNEQLLRMGFYPATSQRPQTVFTFRVLDDFLLTNKECKTPALSYYTRLQRLTNNTFPHSVPVR